MQKEKKLKTIIILFFLVVAISVRFLPHPANFTPIIALALFAGTYLSKKLSLIVPVGAMLISDLFIGAYETEVMLSVYGSLIIFGILGWWLQKHKKWYTIGGGAVVSAVIFFIATNFAVWAFTPWYPLTLSGLVECYTLAIPFFKNTLLSSVFYSAVLFGGYELSRAALKAYFKEKQEKLSTHQVKKQDKIKSSDF